MTRLVFKDDLLDGQLLRTMGHATYGAAEIGECLATATTIREGDRESWAAGWTALAERTFAAGQASLRAGSRESATAAFLRASNYFRNAYVLHLEAPLPAAVALAYRGHRQAFREAAPGLPGTPQPIEIPFEAGALPGYFCSGGPGRRPLVISVGGYDSTAEESYLWNGGAAVARGYHAVIFDGPGQGALLLERGQPFRPDWHLVVGAVLDAFAGRGDVDAGRIAVIGESWGGYLAAGAAARDRRIAACVLDPPQLGLFQAMLARLPVPASLKARLPDGPGWLVALLRRIMDRRAAKLTAGWALRRGMLTHGVASPWDYVLDARRYEQTAVVGDISCPTLVCDAAADEISRQARRFFDLLRCEKTYLRFTVEEGAGAHCAIGNRALYHQRVFDWLDRWLRAEARAAA
jgi:alpha-beta hydrolase superfamily lysophospholipase